MMDVNELVQTVFSGLSPLVMEDVADEGERIVVRRGRRRRPRSVRCVGRRRGGCTAITADGGRRTGRRRRVVVRVRVRRLVCPTRGCRHTFREQVPGVLDRYQRRTTRLTRQVEATRDNLAWLLQHTGPWRRVRSWTVSSARH